MVAGPVFFVVCLREGVSRVHYNPFRHPVSSLAIGHRGWVQTANFHLAGVLSLLFAVGLWSTGPSHWGAALIGLRGVGLLAAGAFRADPVSGYPPGTPGRPPRPTLTGILHNVLSLGEFVALAVACFVFASSGSPGWNVFSIASAGLFAVTMLLAAAAFHQVPRLVEVGGLLQRAALAIAWTWHTALAVRILLQT
ncbi:MAG TPA: DUF998 domain-containing protein [Blastococcus sp.]